MAIASEEITPFMVLQDQRTIHKRRVRLILLISSWVLLGTGTVWCSYFALHSNWLLVGVDVVLICAAFASLRLVQLGEMVQSALLLNATLILVLLGMALFLDLPNARSPRTVHFYLIPLAVATNLLLKDENLLLRHCLPALSLCLVIALSSSTYGVVTSFVIPDGIKIIGVWINCILAMGILYALVKVFFGDIYRMERQLQRAHNRFVDLIGSMFPKSIAERILSTGKTFAERHTNCSILFADIVGFTPLAATLAPEKLVEILSGIFARFDQCVEDFGLTKIKTIGDAYMVASGIPDPDEHHAHKLVEFALRMLEIVLDAEGVELRIGISSGEVVAGVIGQSRQVYDVWGDVVNMASRMESHGLSGHIQVSQQTYDLTQNLFEFSAREVSIKGKSGVHQVYLLGGR